MNSSPKLRWWKNVDTSYCWNVLLRSYTQLFPWQNVCHTVPHSFSFCHFYEKQDHNFQGTYNVLFTTCSLYILYPILSVCWLESNPPTLYLNSFNVIQAEFWQCKCKHVTETISLWIIAIWLFQSLEDRGCVPSSSLHSYWLKYKILPSIVGT